QYLGAILALEIVIACLLRFEKVFFPVTMICFLAADTANPFAGESFTLRWLFLAVGAIAGPVIWMKDNRERHFGTFHLIALFCALAALASATASAAAGIGLLKAGSLFLLFLYAATGGRVALVGREEAFVRGLVLACEVLVFLVCAAYFAGLNVFGNPNNLGAFVGVIAFPIMLWAALVAETRAEVQRRYTALALCAILLYVSVCRAAIVADVLLTIGLTIALRRPRLLIRAAFVGALFVELMAVANPAHMTDLVNTLSGKFIYKIDRSSRSPGILGSRTSPWEDTIEAVKQHPWFGTGFGTSDLGKEQPSIQGSSIYTVEGTNREHGSSYLAMAEYMGLLGILPFLVLLMMLVRAVARVFSWMRRTGSPAHCAVPFALVAAAGLIHGVFEDWMFAPGSYLCVFFWVTAFLLIDFVSPGNVSAAIRVSRSASYAVPALQRSTTPV
ncbi:MAG: O-antigen ligase family protein, partial [Candidatus Sulfotelmatobacter sp.]